MPSFHHDGIQFHYADTGHGLPVVFQHGLGGDVSQPFGLVQPPQGFRLLAFDCRAHGQTQPLGDVAKISMAAFAEDLAAFLDALQIPQAVIGGISMGAAVATRFALAWPQRTLGLILSRPCWLDQPLPDNARVFALMGRLMREHGTAEGQRRFAASAEYRQIQAESEEMAQTLLAQFEKPDAAATAVKFERIAADAPLADLRQLEAIRVPTLVLANRRDPVHPFAYGETLAQRIPGAEFCSITPKVESAAQHAADVQRCVTAFLARHFGRCV
jgi:pimeloyl-ACP methyl ester carboxylesterase